jgi:hypothetical protein
MDGSMLVVGLGALVGAMILTLFGMKTAFGPATCPECSHCLALAEAEARDQERLAREYSKRIGLPEQDDDDRRIG